MLFSKIMQTRRKKVFEIDSVIWGRTPICISMRNEGQVFFSRNSRYKFQECPCQGRFPEENRQTPLRAASHFMMRRNERLLPQEASVGNHSCLRRKKQEDDRAKSSFRAGAKNETRRKAGVIFFDLKCDDDDFARIFSYPQAFGLPSLDDLFSKNSSLSGLNFRPE